MIPDPTFHVVSSGVVLLALGTTIFGVVDGNSAMVIVSVFAAVGATVVRIYSQIRSTRREQDIADAKAIREMSQLEQLIHESDILRDENDRLREQLVRLGVNPWQKGEAGGKP